MFENNGPVVRRDLKEKLWRLEKTAKIDTGIKGYSFKLDPLLPPGSNADPATVKCSTLDPDGTLIIESGYVWDGSSIPFFGRSFDEKISYYPGLVHDVLYEALRADKPNAPSRKIADQIYRDMLIHFGAYKITAYTCYIGLRLFGSSSASPNNGPEYPRRVRQIEE